MTSKEYWQKREMEHAKKNKMSEQTYAEEIRKTYAYMADQIQKEIDGFYAKYANAEKDFAGRSKEKGFQARYRRVWQESRKIRQRKRFF